MIFKKSINGSKKLPWPASSLQCGSVLSFQRKNQQVTVGYMYPWQTVIIYFFQNLGTGASFDSETYQKTQTTGAFIFFFFSKKIGTIDSLIFRIKKLIWRLLTKSRNHTTPPLLVLTAVQISSGYGSKRSLSQTFFFARWWGLGEFMNSLEIAGNLWCMGKQWCRLLVGQVHSSRCKWNSMERDYSNQSVYDLASSKIIDPDKRMGFA